MNWSATEQCIVACCLAFISLAGVSCAIGSVESVDVEPAAQDSLPSYAIPLEDEPPLLLDDAMLPFQDEGPVEGMADNSRCFVCHMNLMQEKLVLTHARAEVGCAMCHGDSDAHIADESWTSGGNGTAPDKMYTPEKVDAFCMKCHEGEKLSEADHALRSAKEAEKKRCTDCHGEHRLANRITKWK